MLEDRLRGPANSSGRQKPGVHSKGICDIGSQQHARVYRQCDRFARTLDSRGWAVAATDFCPVSVKGTSCRDAEPLE